MGGKNGSPLACPVAWGWELSLVCIHLDLQKWLFLKYNSTEPMVELLCWENVASPQVSSGILLMTPFSLKMAGVLTPYTNDYMKFHKTN